MARTKVTPNPPPRVDYKTLYSWASDELLNECTTLTTIKDVEDHRGDPLLYNFNAFYRTHNAHISIRQGTPGEPVCVDDRSRGGSPSFLCTKQSSSALVCAFPLRPLRGSYLLRST